MGLIDDASLEVFSSFVVILLNFLKSNRTIMLRNTIVEKFTFALLYNKIKDIPHEVLKILNERFENYARSKDEEGSQTAIEFNHEKLDFKFKYLDDVFQPNDQEYTQK